MQGRNLGEIFKMHWFANILRYAVSRAKLRRGIWFICTKFCRWKVTRLNLGQGCHLEVPMEITEGLHCNYRVMAWQCLILNIKQYAYMYLQIIEMCQFFVTFWDISPRSNVDTIPVWDCPQDAGFVWGRYPAFIKGDWAADVHRLSFHYTRNSPCVIPSEKYSAF